MKNGEWSNATNAKVRFRTLETINRYVFLLSSFFILHSSFYTIPCAIIAFATFMKPAMLAPFT